MQLFLTGSSARSSSADSTSNHRHPLSSENSRLLSGGVGCAKWCGPGRPPDSRPFDSAQGRLAGATARGLRSWRDYGNFVHSTASEINLPIFGCGHIPYDTATRRNIVFREALLLRIE